VSEDSLGPQQARELSRLIPPPVSRVLVTHLDDPRSIIALAADIDADTIQLHAPFDRSLAIAVRRVFGGTVIQAVHVEDASALRTAAAAAPIADALLLDSRTSSRLGGTGRTHDWRISHRIVREVGRAAPVILAGGLTPANVGHAIATVGPGGVDVNSGVETAGGDKDPALCRRFVAEARAARGASWG
jgi:phosphoribosylanthranilate isomerase